MYTGEIEMKVNHIYRDYSLDYRGRYLAYFGGAGSGKSVYASQWFLTRLLEEDDANHIFLFVRKVARTIKDSLYERMRSEISSLELSKFFKFNKQEKQIECKTNGNKIIMVGIDDPEKIKSIEGITGIFVEEVTELTENDFLQLDLRLRGQHKYPLQFVFSFNPTSIKHWLVKYVEPDLLDKKPNNLSETRRLSPKVWEFDKITVNKEGKERLLTTRVINTTFEDNRFIDEDYKNQLEFLSSISQNYYTIYRRGRWGKEEKGSLFVPSFDTTQHVFDFIEIDPELPLHYTVDFNVDPQMSGLIIQKEYIEEGFWNGFTEYWEYRILGEINASYPNNDAYSLGELFKDRYFSGNLFYLYGDASGMRRLGVKDTKNHFEDLKEGLAYASLSCIDRIPSSNPRYNAIKHGSLGRKAFLNACFKADSRRVPVRIMISKSCEKLILDLEECQDDGTGRLLKKKNKDGIEERGHHLDALQYEICHQDSLGYLAIIKNH